MDRALVAKMLETDPEFGAFVETLYGVSKMDDTSEVHIASGGRLRRRRPVRKSGGAAAATGDPAKDKKIAQTGLAATGVATVGGLHAVKTTLAENAHRTAAAAEGTYQGGKILGKLKPATAAKVAAAGWLGLHGAELVGDGLGARAQTKAIRQANAQQGVSKGIAGHFQPIGNVKANSRARAMGVRLPGATAGHPAGVLRPIAKGINPLRGASQAGKFTRQFADGNARFDAGHTAGYAAGRSAGRTAHSEEMAAAQRGKKRAVRQTAAGGVLVGAGGAVAGQRELEQRAQVGKSFDWEGEISKVDVEKRQVFGWASLSMVDGQPVYDRQGDIIDIEESETAAYKYMLSSRKGGDMHARIGKADGGPKHTADVIESIVFTPEKIEALGLEPDALPLGWWIGMQVHDEQQWDDVKSGKRTGFSVHGTGVRRELELTA